MNPNESTIKHGFMGLGSAIISWLVGACQWYATNMPQITQWLLHIAQIGGIVIMVYSILILRRNWKSGKNNSTDPLNTK